MARQRLWDAQLMRRPEFSLNHGAVASLSGGLRWLHARNAGRSIRDRIHFTFPPAQALWAWLIAPPIDLSQ
jgi:hypothetical protein